MVGPAAPIVLNGEEQEMLFSMVTCKRGTAPPSGACPRKFCWPMQAVNAGNRTPLANASSQSIEVAKTICPRAAGGAERRAAMGKPKTYDRATEKRILSLLDTDPPSGYSQWNGRLLAQSLADVSDDQVWRVLRKHKIQLQRRRSWCIPTDPEFARKSRRHCGALSASSRTCRGGLRQ